MKNYRKFLGPVILIILIAVGLSRLSIESVSEHENAGKTGSKEIGIIVENSETPAESGKDISKNKQKENNDSGKVKKSDNHKSKKERSLKKNGKWEKLNEKNKKKPNSSKDKIKSKKKIIEVKSKKQEKSKEKDNKSKKEKSAKPYKTQAPYKKENVPKKENDNNAEYIKCSISIDCSILLSNMDKLEKNARKYVPKDGKILDKIVIKVKKGSSVYDVLTAACKEKNIAYDAEYSAIYKSSYVKGIGYLYEKMAGDMSGWLYNVDGMTPNVGASAYKIKEGEQIEWIYTCSGRVGS